MATAKVATIGNRVSVQSPYNAGLIAEIKEIEGRRWDNNARAWSVPAESENELREIIRRYFQIEGEESKVEMEVLRLKVTAESSASRSYQGGVSIDGHDLINTQNGSLRKSPNFEILKSEGGFTHGDGYVNLKRTSSHAFAVEYILEIRVRKGARIEATGRASHWGSVEILESPEDAGSSSEKAIDFGVSEGTRLCDCSEQYLKWAAAHTEVYSPEHKWVSIEAKKLLEARKAIQESKKAA